MPRNDEQIAADDALTAAIQQVQRVYNDKGWPQTVMGDYVVVVGESRIDDQGELRHFSSMIFRDGRVSGISAVGLLRMAEYDLLKACSED